jgi:hypothetical protein
VFVKRKNGFDKLPTNKNRRMRKRKQKTWNGLTLFWEKSKQKGKHAQEEKGNHCPHAKLDDKIKWKPTKR